MAPLLKGKSIRLSWVDKVHRYGGRLAYVAMIVATILGLYNRVVVLPKGWGGPFQLPEDFMVPGNTWSFKALGGKVVVYAFIASICIVALLGMFPVTIKPDQTKKTKKTN
eukprot:CAMPEP_0184484748 /NCGR_PEP_ID=MMETSP0113_2-20130426/6429_1 /TAXON_ID=91329 /ORGANISM="Norrisiella sphaerica, Strain BC52" /LENGTH=109 /DNA_ID=CAMNT_0026865869 /DNA_START=54 /DNA_END=383 /DNA_ORIENTATION=+